MDAVRMRGEIDAAMAEKAAARIDDFFDRLRTGARCLRAKEFSGLLGLLSLFSMWPGGGRTCATVGSR
jgi:hypothetical protein